MKYLAVNQITPQATEWCLISNNLIYISINLSQYVSYLSAFHVQCKGNDFKANSDLRSSNYDIYVFTSRHSREEWRFSLSVNSYATDSTHRWNCYNPHTLNHP